MSQARNDAYKYPKLFFVHANCALLPKAQTEEVFFKEHGYEVCFIDNDEELNIKSFIKKILEKIIVIHDLYPSSVFFFNIQAGEEREALWLDLVYTLSNLATREGMSGIHIGIMHELPLIKTDEFHKIIKNPDFLIRLGTRFHGNRLSILNAVEQLKFNKRSVIRVRCIDARLRFLLQEENCDAAIIDMSKNHVSCALSFPPPIMTDTILENISISFEGAKDIQLDVIFMSSRPMTGTLHLWVLFFSNNPADYLRRGGKPNKYKESVSLMEDQVMLRLQSVTLDSIKKNETLIYDTRKEIEVFLAKTALEDEIVIPPPSNNHEISIKPSNKASEENASTRKVKASSISRFLGDHEIELSNDYLNHNKEKIKK